LRDIEGELQIEGEEVAVVKPGESLGDAQNPIGGEGVFGSGLALVSPGIFDSVSTAWEFIIRRVLGVDREIETATRLIETSK